MLLSGALLYLAFKVLADGDTIDFKYIHLAGTLWLDGINPYSAAFRETGQAIFTGMNRPEYLLYPPHWWGISAAVARIPYDTAGLIWRFFMAVCMIAGCFALHDIPRRIIGETRLWRTWAMLIFAAAMSATAVALSLGQTSCLLFLGLCLYLRAYVVRDRGLMVLALVLVMLKPNFGLALSLFLVPALFWWPSLIAGAVAVLALSLPALLPFAPAEVVRGYLNALGQWETLPPNIPGSTTGLRYLAYLLFDLTLPGRWFALAAAALALGLGAIWRDGTRPAFWRAEGLGLLLACLVLIVPMHTYDMMLLIPLIALCAGMPTGIQAALLVLMLVAFRVNNLASALGLTIPEETYFPGSGLVTAVALLIVAVWTVGATTDMARKTSIQGLS